MYELVLERSPNYKSNAANKVKQEILHGLGNASYSLDHLKLVYSICLSNVHHCVYTSGDLYVQAKTMFDTAMYSQLLTILQQTIRNSKSTYDTDSEIVSYKVVK